MKTIKLLGKEVPRVGYGTMRLAGENSMGLPKDRDEAIRVLKHAYELGVRVIDTAWYYGPFTVNEMIKEALSPYPEDLIIITKLGAKRGADGSWLPAHTPEDLRQGMEEDLRTLGLASLSIVHLRWDGTEVNEAFKVAVDTMLDMKKEGKFEHLGLSNVTEEQLDYVLSKTTVATVSNAYNLLDRHDDHMIERCAQEDIPYLPFFPLAFGSLAKQDVLQKWAEKLGVTVTQVALAATLGRSSTILIIPSTTKVDHLEENWQAGNIELPGEALAELLSIPQQASRW
jgi:pyridoxine 4-dehydrogenase